MRALFALLLFASASRFSTAAPPTSTACLPPEQAPTYIVPVRLAAPLDTPVKELAPSDFFLTVDRIRQPICALAHIRQPSSVGIVIDSSQTMSAEAVAAHLGIESIRRMLRSARPDDEFFVVRAGGPPELILPITSDVARVESALTFRPSGQTRLFDALDFALRTLRAARHPNRFLLVISAGFENGSSTGVKDLRHELDRNPTPILLILPESVKGRVPFGPSALIGREDMAQIAKDSGGYALRTEYQKDLQFGIDVLIDAMLAPYLLKFNMPRTIGNSALPKVKVDLERDGSERLILYRGAYELPAHRATGSPRAHSSPRQ